MKAMILAAGLGTRLLPYTLKRPKPLFPILNKPLLHLTIDRLKQAGATEIIVNSHHLRPQIKRALQGEEQIILQEEDTILGTGGGLRMGQVVGQSDSTASAPSASPVTIENLLATLVAVLVIELRSR